MVQPPQLSPGACGLVLRVLCPMLAAVRVWVVALGTAGNNGTLQRAGRRTLPARLLQPGHISSKYLMFLQPPHVVAYTTNLLLCEGVQVARRDSLPSKSGISHSVTKMYSSFAHVDNIFCVTSLCVYRCLCHTGATAATKAPSCSTRASC
jgi:hypothetical protein